MNILAIGAHIGDAELMSGPLITDEILRGNSATVLALTPGELGNPEQAPNEYKIQKLEETRNFCKKIGANSIVFENERDGFLKTNDDLALRLARTIRELRPDVVLAHWKGSFHPDHRAAHNLVERAAFLAGLPLIDENYPRYSPTIKYSENWEDMQDFQADEYHEISSDAFDLWCEAISMHEFAHGRTSGFRYIDYYTALMTAKGCLNNSLRAVALMRNPFATLI